MNLIFLDRIDWEYDAGTPYERPLGGSQSAMCYLSIALAARGHSVTMYTRTKKPRNFKGVNCCDYNKVMPDTLEKCDALIVLNGPADFCGAIRPRLPARSRLILWTQHAHDQPAMLPLDQPEARAGWDVVVCVSQWHATMMQQTYRLDASRVAIMRNAIGPAFVNLFKDVDELAAAKPTAPMLAYTSTPFRGLDLLLAIFPQVHRRDDRARLRVYSSMKVYNEDDSKDDYKHLYAACRSTAGVEYVGAIAQPLLAEAMKSTLILSYPNTFAETSCIAVMEAMAAGLMVVTSDLGALPETTMGMAALVHYPQELKELSEFMRAYLQQLNRVLEDFKRDRQQFLEARWQQVQAINSQCTWAVRAAEWEQFLADRIAAKPQA